jgi:hypothetical protein
MDNMKFRDAHAHMAELQRTADDIRVARAVRRAEAAAADGSGPPGPTAAESRAAKADRRVACPEDLPQTRPA